jgi:hypothetical protein
MATYDESELQESILAGERKLAMKRQQHRRQKRFLWIGAAILAFLLPLGVTAGVVAGRAPMAPSLVVTWPKPKVRQVLAPGQTLLARQGQPFSITTTNSEKWDVTWQGTGISSKGSEFNWAPASEQAELLVLCRPLASGWEQSFAWLWPTRQIALKTVAAQKTGDYGRVLDAGAGGTWVYPHVFASGKVSFDERALPLLASAIELVPRSALSSRLASAEGKITPRLWQIVGDFEGNSAPTQAGTFASLHAPDIENTLPAVSRHILKIAPQISLKFVLRLDKDPQEGIMRLDFDGKRERRAWVRRAGQSAGGPLTGWENEGEGSNLLPSLPRN